MKVMCDIVILIQFILIVATNHATGNAVSNRNKSAHSVSNIRHKEEFQMPPITIEQLCPRGLRLWLPGVPKLRFVGFHVSINSPLQGATPSEYSENLGRPTNGRWQFDIPDVFLQKGDILYHWLHFVVGNQSHLVTDLSWTAPGVICSSNSTSASFHCRTSTTKTLKGQTCVGQLLFEDNFDTFNLERWHHEISASGGRYNEFQMYVNNRSNSFVEDGILHIRPTLTEDVLGRDALYNGVLDLRGSALTGEKCTNPANNGCYKHAVGSQILNPIVSAQLHTSDSFTFQYGIVSVRAKMPKGDWLWPAIYLLPHQNVYGPWPSSGQMTIVESSGNSVYSAKGKSMGIHQVEMGLQLGPGHGAFIKKHFNSKEKEDWNSNFHNFDIEWTPENIKFSIDGEPRFNFTPPLGGGFWAAAGLTQESRNNIYHSGSIMAPFDQQFYLVISLAVGGVSEYFPDSSSGAQHIKPWNNTSPSAMLDFWEHKDSWYPTWQGNSDFQVDYVRIWSLP